MGSQLCSAAWTWIAIDYALSIGIDKIERRCGMLAKELRGLLSAIPGVSIHDLGERPASIVSFAFRNAAAREVMRQLATQKISTCRSRHQRVRHWRQRAETFRTSYAHRRIAAVSTALFARNVVGTGRYIGVSLSQSTAALLGHKFAEHVLEGGAPRQLNVPAGS